MSRLGEEYTDEGHSSICQRPTWSLITSSPLLAWMNSEWADYILLNFRSTDSLGFLQKSLITNYTQPLLIRYIDWCLHDSHFMPTILLTVTEAVFLHFPCKLEVHHVPFQKQANDVI